MVQLNFGKARLIENELENKIFFRSLLKQQLFKFLTFTFRENPISLS